MDCNNKNSKRKQSELESSDSSEPETEISFNYFSNEPGKRQKLSSEAMGSEKKKVQPDFVTTLTDHFDKKVEEMKKDIRDELRPINEKIEKNSDAIKQINEAINRLENEKPAKENAYAAGQEVKEEKYWLSRRSARIWSIEGETEDELLKSCLQFLSNILLIPVSDKMEK